MVSFKAIHPEDKCMILKWRNSDEVAKYMLTDHKIAAVEHEIWFSNLRKEKDKKYWIVMYEASDVGLLSIGPIDWHNLRSYWHFYIGNLSFRGKGIGYSVEYAVLGYVFETLCLNKLCGEVLAFNEVMLKIHSKFGFKTEGFLRKHVKKNNVFHDVVIIGMLRDEWESNRGNLSTWLKSRDIPVDNLKLG